MLKLNNFLMDEAGGDGDGSTGGPSGSDEGGTGSNQSASGNGDAGNPNAGTWFEKADEDMAAYIINKGWSEDALRVAHSYRNLEGKFGKNPDSIIELPRQDDPEGQKAFWQKLGAGENVEAYAFKAPEGMEVNDAYQQHMANAFMELGIPVEKAQGVFDASNAYLMASNEKAAEDYDNQVKADEADLRSEWKDGYDKQMTMAANATKALGLSAEAIDALEATMGYAGVMRMMANLGSKMVEDKFVSTGEAKAFTGQMTPAEAKEQLAAMAADGNVASSLLDKSHPQHQVNVDKRRQLMGIAFPAEESEQSIRA